jgi:O-methyltransferase
LTAQSGWRQSRESLRQLRFGSAEARLARRIEGEVARPVRRPTQPAQGARRNDRNGLIRHRRILFFGGDSMAFGQHYNRAGILTRLFQQNTADLECRIFNEISTGNDIFDMPRMETTRELINSLWYIYGALVDGDVVEFGTMSGFTASRIAKTMTWLEKIMPTPRRLVLADSFEGLPEPTAQTDLDSPHVANGIWIAGSCKVLGRDRLVAMCSREFDPVRIDVLEGWYCDTVPTLPADRKFTMLHVDCDLYQSTMDALTTLFDKGMISEGAVILFDDWNCNRANPAFGERRAWAELVAKYSVVFSHCCDYSWHGHKLIVHSYNGMRASA